MHCGNAYKKPTFCSGGLCRLPFPGPVTGYEHSEAQSNRRITSGHRADASVVLLMVLRPSEYTGINSSIVRLGLQERHDMDLRTPHFKAKIVARDLMLSITVATH
jgi:hypothetical protein